MINFVVGAIVVLIVGSALAYIIKQGKNGVKCIGCPDACQGCKGGCHSFSVPDSFDDEKNTGCCDHSDSE